MQQSTQSTSSTIPLDQSTSKQSTESECPESEECSQEVVVKKRELFLDEFESHQNDQTDKQTKQNRKQVEAILQYTNLPLSDFFEDVEKILCDENDGFFSAHAWTMTTVRSYLISIKSYLNFVSTKVNILGDSIATKAHRVLEKLIAATATVEKFLAPSQIEQYLDSIKVNEIRAVIDLAQTGGSHLLETAVTDCITYLAVHTIITNGTLGNNCSPGVIVHAKLPEYYSGQIQMDGTFIFHVAEHKTAKIYGPAAIVLDKHLYHYYMIYVKRIRPNLVKCQDQGALLLNYDGSNLTRHHLDRNISGHFKQAINVKNISLTHLERSLVSIKAGARTKLARQFPKLDTPEGTTEEHADEILGVQDEEIQFDMVSNIC